MEKLRLLVDCDIGVDDAQAIMMALGQPEVAEVVAITTVCGNTSLDNVTRNALRTLDACDRLDIPVYKGCQFSFLGRGSISDGYFGSDGFGEATGNAERDMELRKLVKEEHAVNAIVNLVNKYPGELTLIALGPLTNIAIAMQIDTSLASKLKKFVIMGGNTAAKGNATVCAEMNFRSDPEAALFVLHTMSRLGELATVTPLELCDENELSWEFYDELVKLPNKKSNFLKSIMQKIEKRERGATLFGTWDQIAMATTLDPSIAIETKRVHMTIELHGSVTRGQTIVDWRGKLEQAPNINLITELDMAKYREQMRKMVNIQ